ncbi:hypothetical protein KKB54_03185, partial [bacterium]|nr:hypothetical protein [bacterium]
CNPLIKLTYLVGKIHPLTPASGGQPRGCPPLAGVRGWKYNYYVKLFIRLHLYIKTIIIGDSS